MGFISYEENGGAYGAYVRAVAKARDSGRIATQEWFDQQLNGFRGHVDQMLGGASAGDLPHYHQEAQEAGHLALGGVSYQE